MTNSRFISNSFEIKLGEFFLRTFNNGISR
jgi:hypothetical protein